MSLLGNWRLALGDITLENTLALEESSQNRRRYANLDNTPLEFAVGGLVLRQRRYSRFLDCIIATRVALRNELIHFLT
jgi:hypothetical protein